MLHIDTLSWYEKLKSAGYTDNQAKVAIELQEEGRKLDLDVIATKTDIAQVKQHIGEVRFELKQDIVELRAELKQDIAELRAELKQDIAELRIELKADILESQRVVQYELNKALSVINGNFRIIFIIGGIVSAVLVIPVLSNWFQPVIQRILGH